ncbi:MAG: hypothetical protein FJ354_02245 [Thaumarchaeota archaeon]|nr:hypothetical protein [Nitrososphaerota archaeon]
MAKKAAATIIIMVSLMVFGYTQYASASQINAKIIESKLLEKSDKGSLYNFQLEFNNPSLLFLTAGKTEFTIIANDKTIGTGELDPFALPALGSATTSGVWLKDQIASENSQIKISGVTKYQLLFASIDVPFTYYPTHDQTREFIADA